MFTQRRSLSGKHSICDATQKYLAPGDLLGWADAQLLLHQMDTSVCIGGTGQLPGTQRLQIEMIYLSSDLSPFATAVPCFPPTCSGKEGKKKPNAGKDLSLWQN